MAQNDEWPVPDWSGDDDIGRVIILVIDRSGDGNQAWETPLRAIRKAIKKMSEKTDRLTAAVAALETKVDELIAQAPDGSAVALAEANAAMDAGSDKIEAVNTKIDETLNPQPPVV